MGSATLDRTQDVGMCSEKKDYSVKVPQSQADNDAAKKRSDLRQFLDKFISKLLLAPSEGMPDKLKAINELKELCLRCREVYLNEASLLNVTPPVYIMGDLHGQFTDLVTMLMKIGTPPRCRFLFLGDYVDRGNWSLETVSLLMAYKLRYPRQVFMLRGNHETRAVNRVYGFFEECSKRFPDRGEGTALWTLYQHVFNCLPLAAIVGERIFTCHGGISEDLKSWRQFSRIRRPTDITDIGFINDLIWADPCDACERYAESPRGVSQVFGKVAIDEFEESLQIDLIVRGHQVVMDGYEFFHEKRCLTIFSAPCYCNEMNNIAGILFVSSKLECAIYTYRSPNRAPESSDDQPNADKGKAESDAKPSTDKKQLASSPVPSKGTLNKKEDAKDEKKNTQKKETPKAEGAQKPKNGGNVSDPKTAPTSPIPSDDRDKNRVDSNLTSLGSKTGAENDEKTPNRKNTGSVREKESKGGAENVSKKSDREANTGKNKKETGGQEKPASKRSKKQSTSENETQKRSVSAATKPVSLSKKTQRSRIKSDKIDDLTQNDK